MLSGLIEQMRKDKRISREMHCGAVVAEEETYDWERLLDRAEIEIFYELAEVTEDERNADEEQCWDDITGEPLDRQGVKQAREDEMSEVRKHRVYTKVPISECWDKTGKAPIAVRWIDINKGDRVHPDYRSRLVVKEIRIKKRCGKMQKRW